MTQYITTKPYGWSHCIDNSLLEKERTNPFTKSYRNIKKIISIKTQKNE